VTRAREHQSGGSRNARRSRQRDRTFGGLCPGDRPLLPDEEPPLGSHLVTPRRGFAHHGIYVGRGNVVHYRSLVRKFCRGPVEEVSLARFAQGRKIWVRSHTAPRFDTTEVTRRARSRVGEDRYRLFSNNCEHFCQWCLRDEHRSYQVERLRALPRQLARLFGDTIARLVPEDHAASDRPSCVLRALPPSRSR
jgi:hypothetical protein